MLLSLNVPETWKQLFTVYGENCIQTIRECKCLMTVPFFAHRCVNKHLLCGAIKTKLLQLNIKNIFQPLFLIRGEKNLGLPLGLVCFIICQKTKPETKNILNFDEMCLS